MNASHVDLVEFGLDVQNSHFWIANVEDMQQQCPSSRSGRWRQGDLESRLKAIGSRLNIQTS